MLSFTEFENILMTLGIYQDLDTSHYEYSTYIDDIESKRDNYVIKMYNKSLEQHDQHTLGSSSPVCISDPLFDAFDFEYSDSDVLTYDDAVVLEEFGLCDVLSPGLSPTNNAVLALIKETNSENVNKFECTVSNDSRLKGGSPPTSTSPEDHEVFELLPDRQKSCIMNACEEAQQSIKELCNVGFAFVRSIHELKEGIVEDIPSKTHYRNKYLASFDTCHSCQEMLAQAQHFKTSKYLSLYIKTLHTLKSLERNNEELEITYHQILHDYDLQHATGCTGIIHQPVSLELRKHFRGIQHYMAIKNLVFSVNPKLTGEAKLYLASVGEPSRYTPQNLRLTMLELNYMLGFSTNEFISIVLSGAEGSETCICGFTPVTYNRIPSHTNCRLVKFLKDYGLVYDEVNGFIKVKIKPPWLDLVNAESERAHSRALYEV